MVSRSKKYDILAIHHNSQYLLGPFHSSLNQVINPAWFIWSELAKLSSKISLRTSTPTRVVSSALNDLWPPDEKERFPVIFQTNIPFHSCHLIHAVKNERRHLFAVTNLCLISEH